MRTYIFTEAEVECLVDWLRTGRETKRVSVVLRTRPLRHASINAFPTWLRVSPVFFETSRVLKGFPSARTSSTRSREALYCMASPIRTNKIVNLNTRAEPYG